MAKNKKKYKVYVRNDEYIRVKQGVSWVGFFFTFFWFYYKKAYRLCAKIFLTIEIGFSFFAALGAFIVKYAELNTKSNPDEVGQFIVLCGGIFCFLVGAAIHYKGNKWLEKDLLERGFVEVEDVESVPQNLLFDKKRFNTVAGVYIVYRIGWELLSYLLPIIYR